MPFLTRKSSVRFCIALLACFSFFLAFDPGLSSADVISNLLSYWKLDDSPSDAQGTSNGSLLGGAAFTNSAAPTSYENPKALSLDGIDDAVSIPHSPALNAFPITISAWVRTSPTTKHIGIVNKYTSGSYNGYQILLHGGNVYAWYFKTKTNCIWDGSLGLNGGSIADGQWHHVAFTVDPSGGRLYVDGVLKASRAWTGPAGATTTTFNMSIGRYGSNYLAGAADDVRIYSRALTAADVSELAARQQTVPTSGVDNYWTLDNTANDALGTAHGVVNGAIFSTASAPTTFANSHALFFDGINDTVTVQHTAQLNKFPLSIACWLKTSQTTQAGLVNKYVSSSSDGYQLYLNGGNVYAWYFKSGNDYVWDGAAGLNGGPVDNDNWHHVAFTVDNSGGKLYVDGALTASRAWTGTFGPPSTTQPLSLGVNPGGSPSYFAGLMDDVRHYNRALSQAEVAALAARAAPPNQAPTVNAGSDQALSDLTAQLNGTVSDDGLPNPPGAVTTSWSKIAGPANVNFANSNALATAVNLTQSGTYTLRLTASDSVLTATDDIIITVTDTPPPPDTTPLPEGAIPLTFSTALEIPFPIATGVPFPKGVVSSLDHLRVEDSAGVEVPAQFEGLVNWPDGSFKSVLIMINALAGANEYRVRYGPDITNVAYATNLSVNDGATAITVSTGPIQFRLDKTRFTLLDEVWRDLNGNRIFDDSERIMGRPGEIFLIDAFDNVEYKASLFQNPVYTIEEQGPMRAVIRAAGKLQAADARTLTDFIVRIYAFADKDYVKIEYTLVDTRTEINVSATRANLALSVKGYGLKIPYRLTNLTYSFGGENDQVYSGPVTADHSLYQNGELVYIDGSLKPFTFNYSGAGSGAKAPGWFDIKNGTAGIAVMLKDFWQQFPKKLAVENEEIVIYLHPLEASGPTPDLKYPTLDPATKVYKRPNTFYFSREGGAKTYQMLLQFSNGGQNPMSSTLNKTFQAAPRLKATAKWYMDSKAFGNMVEAGSWSNGFDVGLINKIYIPSITNFRSTGGLAIPYGWRDFGDRMRTGWMGTSNTVRYPGFYNDTHVGAHNFFDQYLRTLDERWWELGEIATRHWMDIDVSHTNRYGYWNNSFGPGEGHLIKHEVMDHSSRNLHHGHAHISGLPDYYLLTGDKRGLEVMKEVGNWWANATPVKFPTPVAVPHRAETERDFAWPLFTMLEAFRGTGDTRYLQAAAQTVRHLIGWWQTPSNHLVNGVVVGQNDWTQGTGWWYMYPKCDNCSAGYNGTNPWMAGALLTSLIEFYEVNKDFNYVDNNLVKEMLMQTMNYVVKYGYEEQLQPNPYFVYSEGTRTTNGGANHIVFPLAYLGRLYMQGGFANPQWYDTAPRWLAIAKNYYDGWKIVRPGGTQSYGFYGYEIVHDLDFFAIMKELEDAGQL